MQTIISAFATVADINLNVYLNMIASERFFDLPSPPTTKAGAKITKAKQGAGAELQRAPHIDKLFLELTDRRSSRRPLRSGARPRCWGRTATA